MKTFPLQRCTLETVRWH
ncbi:hypothetical protein Bhyg_12777 [Pseudolycoriella hygida]|uniref:Uncharacterized protein n=1 Tax=Pseudolycoriella hygida TaxID=35572 RepID=A0A9Q0MY60_9DIPT|nr:hypothetical protein Bhyg_12777 [Pseudolycoriella hygida]